MRRLLLLLRDLRTTELSGVQAFKVLAAGDLDCATLPNDVTVTNDKGATPPECQR